MTHDLGGNIKRIQWNNRIMTLLLSLLFILGIFIFVSLLMMVFVGTTMLISGDMTLFEKFGHDPMLTLRVVKPYMKVFAFVIFGYIYFITRDLNNIEGFFHVIKLELPHNDEFYKILENFCIMRGVQVPVLYILGENSGVPSNYITGAVVQDIKGRASLLFTPAVYNLNKQHAEAFLAQAVQRIYSGDTMFLTVFCFLGYFPYHMRQRSHKYFRPILEPFLRVTDFILAPIRRMILEMRFARLDAGALELTKEKSSTAELLNMLTHLKDLREYYHDPYLSLFIGRSEEDYRKLLLSKA